MSRVIPIHRCRCCGQSGTTRALYLNDAEVASFFACDSCIADVDGQLARVRPVFDAMIAAGVRRDTANEIMTELLSRIDRDSERP